MGELIRSKDWSTTPLGPIENWPQSLRTSVSLCLSSTFPISICWGPEMVQIYNDAYRPICGDAHPASMGERFWTIWESARPAVGAVIEKAKSGTGSYIENQRMFLERKGYLEEAWMTFSFSPIREEGGGVGGLFHPITETTERMLASRRNQILRDLTARVAEAKSVKELFAKANEQAASFENDIPYLVFYSVKDGVLEFESEVGIRSSQKEGKKNLPSTLILQGDEAHAKAMIPFANPTLRLSFEEAGPYPELPKEAFLLPLILPGTSLPMAYAIAGVSARREVDAEYKDFFEKLGSNLNAALSRIKAFEQEQERVTALAEIDRSKTVFFSNVSHELRTPLTLILGPLEDLLEKSEVNDRTTLDLIYRNAKRLLKLVNTILDFSRIEAGRMKSQFSPVPLVSVTKELASIFRSAIEKAGLSLSIEGSEFSQPIYVDREMWERIVLNLMSNALKYTTEGQITLRFVEREDEVLIEVEDSGIGIPKDELPKLFERFHRVEGAKGRTHEGTGIGLSLVQELVKLQGGSIHIRSEENKGSTFTVCLKKGTLHIPPDRLHESIAPSKSLASPFLEEIESWLKVSDTSSEAKSLRDTAQDLTLHKARILVADDNSDMLSYVSDLLSNHWDVTTARNGLEAWQLLQTSRFDLVLTDVMMPEMNGFELLREIRKNVLLQTIPVIMLSARAGEEAKVEGLSEGADDYLIKPFSARELIGRVSAALKVQELRTRSIELQQERLKSAFAHSSVGMAILTPGGQILETNDAFDKILGYQAGELKGVPLTSFNHPEFLASSLSRWDDLLSGRIPSFTVEKPLVRKDGEASWVENSVSPLKDEHGEIQSIIVVSQDISQRKSHEEDLRLAQQKAEVANQAKSRFLANVSHEIRTPLGIIRGYCELLREPSVPESEKNAWLDTIHTNSEHLTLLIDDILDMSKVEANLLEVKSETFDLSKFLDEIEESFRMKAAEKSIVFAVVRDKNLPQKIETDPFRLRQILTNILGNACKFTSKGMITLRVKVEKDKDQSAQLVFRCQDSGIGISPEQKERLFQAFTQGNISVTRTYGGTGLGLFISKKIANMLHGDLILEHSEAGVGSVFTLSLDADKVMRFEDSTSLSVKSEAEGQATKQELPTLASGNFLIVEDTPELRLLAKRMLQIFGAKEIDLANDGSEALEKCAQKTYDVIFMDMEMPILGGIDTVKALRARNYPGAIVALTAHAMSSFREECLASGFDSFMVKPFQKEDLYREALKYLKTTLP